MHTYVKATYNNYGKGSRQPILILTIVLSITFIHTDSAAALPHVLAVAESQVRTGVLAKQNQREPDPTESIGSTESETKPGEQLPASVQNKLDTLLSAVQLAQQSKRDGDETKSLLQLAKFYDSISEFGLERRTYSKALDLARNRKDPPGQAAALAGLAKTDNRLADDERAMQECRDAFSIAYSLQPSPGMVQVFIDIGYAFLLSNQYSMSQFSYGRAFAIAQSVGDTQGEGTALADAGLASGYFEHTRDALSLLNRALLVFQKTNDRAGEAKVFTDYGFTYYNAKKNADALDFFSRGLPLFREIGDRLGEANSLTMMGHVNSRLGKYRDALNDENHALLIWREVRSLTGEANELNNIGLAQYSLGELGKALDCFKQALIIGHRFPRWFGEATILNSIALIYSALGDEDQAIGYFKQVLSRSNDPVFQNNIAVAYLELGNTQEALRYLNQAFADSTGSERRGPDPVILNSMGRVYQELKQYQEALRYFSMALKAERKVSARGGEASTLVSIGDVLSRRGERQEALNYFGQALRSAIAVEDPLSESIVLGYLMNWHRKVHPALAIFYGKVAINLLQQVRSNIQGLDKGLQQIFLTSKSDAYRELADLLIRRGRLAEAEQVLDLLKQDEYSHFVRAPHVLPVAPLSLTPSERRAEEEYQHETLQLVSQNRQWNELNEKGASKTDEESREFVRLSAALANGSAGLQGYYARLYRILDKGSDANRQLAGEKTNISQVQQMVQGFERTIAFRTLVAKDRYNVIVITGTGSPIGRKYDITREALNRKVSELRNALTNTKEDPRPLAEELYKIIIGPVQADLDQSGAQTIVWTLDGVLRYIPLEALYDGKHYLVERYKSVIVTPASMPYPADAPLRNPSAVAMGISRKYEERLDYLGSVADELKQIVRDPEVKDSHGVLTGSILLDGQFTEKAMRDRLNAKPTVVHIASHFVLAPGDDERSYLLLAGKDEPGTGYHLTVSEFRNDPNLNLTGADLLTLSACETGPGSSKKVDGEEVEGIGEVAQLDKHAKSVISSLWKVYDPSTSELMADFYKLWVEGNGKLMKAEALRQAQLDLLQGRILPKNDASDPDAPTSFAHPYYWAPFVLMGNWK